MSPQHDLGSHSKDQPLGLAVWAAIDIAIVGISGLFAFFARYGHLDPEPAYRSAVLVAMLTAAYHYHRRGLHAVPARISLVRDLRSSAIAWAWIAMTTTLFVYFAKTSDLLSRLWMVAWWTMGFVLLLCSRALLVSQLKRWRRVGELDVHIVVVGSHQLARALSARGRNRTNARRRRVVSIVNLPERPDESGLSVVLAEVARAFERYRVEEIFVAAPSAAGDAITRTLHRLKMFPARIHICCDLPYLYEGFSWKGAHVSDRMLLLTLCNKPLSALQIVLKRLEDIVLSGALFFATFPVQLLIALAIKLETPGPVLFRQKRFGFQSNVIEVSKFRTMWHNTQEQPMRQATRGDSRVTWIGRWLRRTSLDELPQLFNVLQGRMSLVGPRPHPMALDERFSGTISDYLARHRVRPGITGWAQVNGCRGETEHPRKMLARVEHDLYYVENWSLGFDFKILLLTVPAILSGRNAH